MPLAATSLERMAVEDVASVRALLVEGLKEHWGHYDPKFNPDLEDFPSFYQDSVILVAKSGSSVVGVGILQPENAENAKIVRMSVSAEARRMGVGSRILGGLLAAARQQGFRNIGLETTASWKSAVEFYKVHGFVPTHVQNGDQYFSYAASEA